MPTDMRVLSFRVEPRVRSRMDSMVKKLHKRGIPKWQVYQWALEVGLEYLEEVYAERGATGLARECAAHHGGGVAP